MEIKFCAGGVLIAGDYFLEEIADIRNECGKWLFWRKGMRGADRVDVKIE